MNLKFIVCFFLIIIFSGIVYSAISVSTAKINHATLNNLWWSKSGHVLDSNFDFVDYNVSAKYFCITGGTCTNSWASGFTGPDTNTVTAGWTDNTGAYLIDLNMNKHNIYDLNSISIGVTNPTHYLDFNTVNTLTAAHLGYQHYIKQVVAPSGTSNAQAWALGIETEIPTYNDKNINGDTGSVFYYTYNRGTAHVQQLTGADARTDNVANMGSPHIIGTEHMFSLIAEAYQSTDNSAINSMQPLFVRNNILAGGDVETSRPARIVHNQTDADVNFANLINLEYYVTGGNLHDANGIKMITPMPAFTANGQSRRFFIVPAMPDGSAFANTTSRAVLFEGTSGTSRDGISFANDTNLYRESAGTLKTNKMNMDFNSMFGAGDDANFQIRKIDLGGTLYPFIDGSINDGSHGMIARDGMYIYDESGGGQPGICFANQAGSSNGCWSFAQNGGSGIWGFFTDLNVVPQTANVPDLGDQVNKWNHVYANLWCDATGCYNLTDLNAQSSGGIIGAGSANKIAYWLDGTTITGDYNVEIFSEPNTNMKINNWASTAPEQGSHLILSNQRGTNRTDNIVPLNEWDILGSLDFTTIDSTGNDYIAAQIKTFTIQNNDDSFHGVQTEFWVTPRDSNAMIQAVIIHDDGKVGILQGLTNHELDVNGDVGADCYYTGDDNGFCSKADLVAWMPSAGGFDGNIYSLRFLDNADNNAMLFDLNGNKKNIFDLNSLSIGTGKNKGYIFDVNGLNMLARFHDDNTFGYTPLIFYNGAANIGGIYAIGQNYAAPNLAGMFAFLGNTGTIIGNTNPAADGNIDFYTSGLSPTNLRIRITADGNTGFFTQGTISNPISLVDIHGALALNAMNTPAPATGHYKIYNSLTTNHLMAIDGVGNVTDLIAGAAANNVNNYWSKNGNDLNYSSGSVGIGDTPDNSYNLDVNGSGGIRVNNNDNTNLALTDYTIAGRLIGLTGVSGTEFNPGVPLPYLAGKMIVLATGAGMGNTDNNGVAIVSASADANTDLYTGGIGEGNLRMRITNDGNVGIGTGTFPIESKLDIHNGAIALQGFQKPAAITSHYQIYNSIATGHLMAVDGIGTETDLIADRPASNTNNYWTKIGNDLNYNTGSVGIGDVPDNSYNLDVNGSGGIRVNSNNNEELSITDYTIAGNLIAEIGATGTEFNPGIPLPHLAGKGIFLTTGAAMGENDNNGIAIISVSADANTDFYTGGISAENKSASIYKYGRTMFISNHGGGWGCETAITKAGGDENCATLSIRNRNDLNLNAGTTLSWIPDNRIDGNSFEVTLQGGWATLSPYAPDGVGPYSVVWNQRNIQGGIAIYQGDVARFIISNNGSLKLMGNDLNMVDGSIVRVNDLNMDGKLTITDDAVNGISALRLIQTSGADASYELRATDQLTASGNAFGIWGGLVGSESYKLVISTVGNVGLNGLTDSNNNLQIRDTGTGTTLGQLPTNLRLQTQTATANSGSELSFSGSGEGSQDNISTFAALSARVTANNATTGTTGYLSLSTKAAQADTTLTERMRIAADGNIIAYNDISAIKDVNISGLTKLWKTDAPRTCNATTEGAIYYDISEVFACLCNATNWVRFDDGTTCT